MTLARALAVLVGLAAAGFIGFGLGVGLGRVDSTRLVVRYVDPSQDEGA